MAHFTFTHVHFHAHATGTPPRVQERRQFDWEPRTSQLRSVFEPTLCLTLNRSKILTYIEPPCVWPSLPPPDDQPWTGPSPLLQGITILENVTAIPGYDADTWYPTQDRDGKLYSGFDDGVVGAVTVGSSAPAFLTGTAVVSGAPDWRNLSVHAVGGAVYEEGRPMNGPSNSKHRSPFFQNSGFEMCFGPAGAKTRLESRIKKFTPHCIYRPVHLRQRRRERHDLGRHVWPQRQQRHLPTGRLPGSGPLRWVQDVRRWGAHLGQLITHYKTKWRNIWIRDVVSLFLSDPCTFGPGVPNQNTSRIQIL